MLFRSKKADRKQGEKQYRNGGGTCADPFFSDAEPYDQRYGDKIYHHNQNVPDVSAHRHGEYQRKHTETCYDAEHTFMQADPVIGDDFKPFSNHAVSLT